jgi:hypothetical protein
MAMLEAFQNAPEDYVFLNPFLPEKNVRHPLSHYSSHILKLTYLGLVKCTRYSSLLFLE